MLPGIGAGVIWHSLWHDLGRRNAIGEACLHSMWPDFSGGSIRRRGALRAAWALGGSQLFSPNVSPGLTVMYQQTYRVSSQAWREIGERGERTGERGPRTPCPKKKAKKNKRERRWFEPESPCAMTLAAQSDVTQKVPRAPIDLLGERVPNPPTF